MKRFIPTLPILLTLGLLAGCAVGPDYRRPDLTVPGSYRYEVKDASDTANTEWWHQFEDPVLDELIDEALANNKSVKIAAAKVEQASGLLIQTRSPDFPADQLQRQRRATAPYGTRRNTHESPPSPIRRRPTRSLPAASWEIDLWGRIRRLTESAQANLLASEYAKQGVVLSLVASVASSYLQLRGLDEQLLLSRQTLAAYAETVEDLRTAAPVRRRLQDDRGAGAFPVRNGGGGDPGHRVPDRADGECDLHPARSQSRPYRSRQIDHWSSRCPRSRPACLHRCWNADPTSCRPSSSSWRPTPRSVRQGHCISRRSRSPAITATQARDLSNLFKGPARVWSYGGSVTGPIFAGGAI